MFPPRPRHRHFHMLPLPSLSSLCARLHDAVTVLLRRQPPRLCRKRNLLAVLVSAREEVHVPALQPMEARQHVRCNGRVRAAHVGR
eukprot:365756-Chlamydomonas_euryale.AAC.14